MKPQDRTRLILRSKLDQESKLVALAIADHMNDADAAVWPSVSTLAELSSLGLRTVQSVIIAGCSTGWLERQDRNGASALLRINWTRLVELAGLTRTTGTRKLAKTPAPGAPPRPMRTPSAPRAGVPPRRAHPTPAPGAPEADQGSDQLKRPGERSGPSPKDDPGVVAIWATLLSLARGFVPGKPTQKAAERIRDRIAESNLEHATAVVRYVILGPDKYWRTKRSSMAQWFEEDNYAELQPKACAWAGVRTPAGPDPPVQASDASATPP